MQSKLIRTALRLAMKHSGSLLGKARKAAPVQSLMMRARPKTSQAEPLRGSGSWEMAYEGGQEIQPLPRNPKKSAAAAPKARVAIHPVRILSDVERKMYEHLGDLLEAEAPLLTLHAQISLDRFLHVDRRASQSDQDATRAIFAGDIVTFLVVDEVGLPVLGIDMLSGEVNASARKQKAQILEEAGVSLIGLAPGCTADAAWDDISLFLDLDEDLAYATA